MSTNYLGPFLLTMLLLPCMQRTAKVVRACAAHIHSHFCVQANIMRCPCELYVLLSEAQQRAVL